MSTIRELKDFLLYLGFLPEEGKSNIWTKNYSTHNNYRISLDFNTQLIEYGPKILLGDKTTCNFKSNENFVVLECVNRLMEKGYPPEAFTLEKDYPLGHKTKGKLDILINDSDGKAFLMIECKTWGIEYDKAARKTLSNGGQLLSYFQQDTSAKYLCLYTSRFESKHIEYINGIIKVEPEFLDADNINEVFERWNKNLKDNGIFEVDSTPYNIVIKSLSKATLKPLTKDDSSRIFNQFAEILRHHVVSDKPNAFNKLITLLLCKIVDEDRADIEELHFQWLETDTNIELQKRLNDLYKIGMEKYLTKVVTDYSDKDVEDIVGLDETQKDIIKNMMTELRLKKNNEFAFKEVFNNDSFEENSKVLKEVVELLQPYQVRYNKKQQFLGDFFELLLNTSIKQEAGQYFTPVPIARFIINSLPIKELIIKKIHSGENEFLPYVIDYAVGSGHFLTEVMDEIHTIIKKLNEDNTYKPSIKKNLNKWAEDYDWAYDFIYGIEKDYRLVKTAKVSCFLNGDGLARIFNADGLANFVTSNDYKDKLKFVKKSYPKDNQQFDILIANPPYSVSAFKNTLIDGEKSFDLYNRLTDDSSEIECLFIERTKQLLKDDGYAGIVLPSSILSNSGIYEDAREILLKYFKIIAITEFGSNTFMATGTNTVTLFLQKRNGTDWQKIDYAINQFFINAIDVTVNGIENIFSKYIAHVYKTLSFDDYTSLIHQKPNDNIIANGLFIDYHKAFYASTPIKNLTTRPTFKKLNNEEQQTELNRLFIEDTLKREKEKLLYFILTYPQQTLFIKSNPDGKNETEKAFLGYEFSNRRGHEGIKPYGGQSIAETTKLYEQDVLNPKRVNTHIYKAFLSEESDSFEGLESYISKHVLVDLLTFDRVMFSKSISLSIKKKKTDWSKVWNHSNLIPITNIATIKKGTSIVKSATLIGNIPVVAGGKVPAYFHNVSNRTGDVITISASGANAGYINFYEQDIFASDCITVQSKDEEVFSTRLIYQLLFYCQDKIYQMQRGQAQPHVYSNDLETIKLPIISNDDQEIILKQIKLIDLSYSELLPQLQNLEQLITKKFLDEIATYPKNKFSTIATLEYGASLPERSRRKGEYPVMGSNGIIGYHNSFLIESPSIIVGRKGSVGKVTLIYKNTFPIDTAFFVSFNKQEVDFKFLYHLLLSLELEDLSLKTGVPGLNRNEVHNLRVNIPPIEIQKEISRKIKFMEDNVTSLKKKLAELIDRKTSIITKYIK